MPTRKTKVLAVALALAASPLFAMAQGTPPAPQNPPPPDQGQTQNPNSQPQRHRRHRRRHRRHHRRHRRPPVAMMLRNPAFRERLGITPEQAARIQAQQSSFAKTMIRGRAEVQVKRLELAGLLAAEKPDRAQLEKKLRELNEAQFAMRKAALDQRLAMREAFTPEQRDTLREMVREFRMRQMQGDGDEPGRGWRGAPRRGPGPPPPPGM